MIYFSQRRVTFRGNWEGMCYVFIIIKTWKMVDYIVKMSGVFSVI